MNQTIFGSDKRSSRLPDATTVNHAGGKAYELSDQAALAQLTLTGCFNNTYYVTGEEQIKKVVELCGKVCPEYIAKLAVYARKNGHLKDSPAVLLAYLAVHDALRFVQAAKHVLDGGRMVRNLVNVCRSGVLGHKSIPRPARRALVTWLRDRPGDKLFRDTVGNDPSIADILRMLHPKPKDAAQGMLWNYILGRGDEETWGHLPQVIQTYERFKRETLRGQLPDVPFQMLTGFKLGKDQWKDLAAKMSWQELRQSLNALADHGVFEIRGTGSLTAQLALKLGCPNEVAKARVFPYQLLTTFLNVKAAVPEEFREALQDAMEAATRNVPTFDEGKEHWFLVDISGSMRTSPVTGQRAGATTKAMAIQVAALLGASFARANKGNVYVVPFSDRLYSEKEWRYNPRDSVMTVAKQLSDLPSGGTNCALPVQAIVNGKSPNIGSVIFASDNESWMDSLGRTCGSVGRGSTALMQAWGQLKKLNPTAKLVCIDLTPNTNVQAINRSDILNIGGWSDAIWPVIAGFVNGDEKSTLTNAIEAVTL